MNQEERVQKIDIIMSEVKKRNNAGVGIPIELWIAAENGKPGEPEFEKWLMCCTEAVDNYFANTGKKDRDSIFAEHVREYGRREEGSKNE